MCNMEIGEQIEFCCSGNGHDGECARLLTIDIFHTMVKRGRYAHTREECEAKLAEMIERVREEIKTSASNSASQ